MYCCWISWFALPQQLLTFEESLRYPGDVDEESKPDDAVHHHDSGQQQLEQYSKHLLTIAEHRIYTVTTVYFNVTLLMPFTWISDTKESCN